MESHLLGHFGADAIVNDIHMKGMHWPHIKNDALRLTQSCAKCLQVNTIRRGYNPLRPISCDIAGDHWSIDLAGPLIKTDRGNEFLLIMVDICTRFCLLKPIPDKTADTIVTRLIDAFTTFGIPRIVSSDNGKEFANDLMELFTKTVGIDHRLITPYNPRANGSAERWVQSAINGIKKSMEGAIPDWDLYVPATQLALNVKVSTRHKSRPFALMFARNLNEFKDYSKDAPRRSMSVEEMIENANKMEEIIFPAINERTLQVNEARKKEFDKKHKLVEFKPNDHVMVAVRKNDNSNGSLENNTYNNR